MRKLINIEKLLRMDNLIRRKSSGLPEKFASRLGISRSTLFEYLLYLKEEFMATIHYNRYTQNYEYKKEPELLSENLLGEVGMKEERNCVDCPLLDCPRRKI